MIDVRLGSHFQETVTYTNREVSSQPMAEGKVGDTNNQGNLVRNGVAHDLVLEGRGGHSWLNKVSEGPHVALKAEALRVRGVHKGLVREGVLDVGHVREVKEHICILEQECGIEAKGGKETIGGVPCRISLRMVPVKDTCPAKSHF